LKKPTAGRHNAQDRRDACPAVSFFPNLDAGEQAFQTVQPRLLRLVFGVQNLSQIFNAVVNVPDGFGQNGAGGVGAM
jgi:hypothetical protein